MSKKETMRQRVQEALAGEPLKVGVLAAKLKSSGPTIRYHLLALAKDGLVRQLEPGNRMSAWTSGDGTAPAESRKPGKRVNGARRLPKGGAVQDYQLKIIVLDEVIKEADGSELRAAALRAIRADLQRLAA